MTTFFAMSLYGAAMTAVIMLFRRLFIGVIPKKAFKILWLLTAARLLVPAFIPIPIYVKATAVGGKAAESVPKELIFAVWAAGTAVSAGIFGLAYIKSLRNFSGARTVHNSALSRLIGGFGLRRRVETRVCRGASSPVTYGLFRPKIILPENFREYGGEQVSCAVLHEMQHIVSLDALYKPIIAAAACLHWFNPAAWAMLIMAGRDAEIACDEAVLKKIGREKREEYALALLACEERRGGVPAAEAFAKNAVKERIELIMKYKKTTSAAVIAAIAVIGCTAAVFAVSPELRTADEPADKTIAQNNGADHYYGKAETDTNLNNGTAPHSDGGETSAYTYERVPIDGDDMPNEDGVVRHSDSGETSEYTNKRVLRDGDDVPNEDGSNVLEVITFRKAVNIDGTELKLPPKANYGELRNTSEDERLYGEEAAKLLEACFDGEEDFTYPVDSVYNGGYEYTGGFIIPAQKGENVCSMLDGKVIYADMSCFPFGNAAVIDHGDGNVCLYAHCSDLCVSEGDEVKSGDVIGHVGSTGAAPDNRLYVYKY